MGACYDKLLNTCCPSSPEEEHAQQYMAQHHIYDVPDRVSKTFQWILLISLSLEFIVAVGALVFGVYGYSVRQEFGTPADITDTFIEVLINLPIALIVMGSVSIIFIFLGGLGAIREYVPLLATYLAYLILITITQVFVGIYFLAKKETLLNNVRNYFTTNGIVNYFEDIDLKNLIDYMQQGFDCCGSVEYKDWGHNMYFNCSHSNPSIQACSTPSSCCISSDTSSGMDIITNTYCGKGALEKSLTEAQKVVYTDGCFDKILSYFTAYTVVIVIVILVLVVGPLIQEVCICFLIYDVNAERQAFDMWKGDQFNLSQAARDPMAQPVDPLLSGGAGEVYRYPPGWRPGPAGRSEVAPYQAPQYIGTISG